MAKSSMDIRYEKLISDYEQSLTSYESAIHDELVKVIEEAGYTIVASLDGLFSKNGGAPPVEMLDDFFISEDYRFEFKRFISLKYCHHKEAVRWGYEYLAGDDLNLLCHQSTALRNTGHYYLAANVNLTWDIAWTHMLRPFSFTPDTFRNEFIEELNDTVFTEEFAFKLLDNYDDVDIKESVLVKRFRKLFNMDDNIPDSWVAKMVQDLAS